MVVLTINAPSNDCTVYFDQPIPKGHIKGQNPCRGVLGWLLLPCPGKDFPAAGQGRLSFPFYHWDSG